MSVSHSPGLLLLGFCNEARGIGLLASSCVCRDTRPSTLKAIWADAKKRRGGAVAKAGQPEILELPDDVGEHVEKLLQLPRLQRGIDGMAAAPRMVEAERLMAIQPSVYTERVRAMAETLGREPSIGKLTEVCLPLEAKLDPADVAVDLGPPLRVVTRNPNLTSFHVIPPHDPAEGFLPLLFWLGEREPCIQIIHFKGKFYLRNGYHRVLAARLCGATHIPALVMEASSWNDVHKELGKGSMFDPRLQGDQMPCVRHFDNGCEVDLRLSEWIWEFAPVVTPHPI